LLFPPEESVDLLELSCRSNLDRIFGGIEGLRLSFGFSVEGLEASGWTAPRMDVRTLGRLTRISMEPLKERRTSEDEYNEISGDFMIIQSTEGR
jgi:hypothetical protein